MPLLYWPIVLFSLCLALMSEWWSSRIIHKRTKRALYGWNNTHRASWLRSLHALFSWLASLLPPFFSQRTYLKSSWVLNLSLFLSLPLSHTHLVSWLQQGLKRLQFISTHSGWRPHLVAAGNSISLPHTDEWVTTFSAPVNMCLLW